MQFVSTDAAPLNWDMKRVSHPDFNATPGTFWHIKLLNQFNQVETLVAIFSAVQIRIKMGNKGD